ncbi:hypothetical protein CPB86DRAFT_779366 [Serendipita vermifera]|nr:hypothetical protein CPB86DRAFT_779366 [Serendipita vermifera]
MLARHVRIPLQRHKNLYTSQFIRIGASRLNPSFESASSRRHISLTSVTEPLNRAIESLPNAFQHTIPDAILNLSEAWVPASLPTYTTGIVAFAILTRLCVFTPWVFWARKRKWRVQEQVRPQAIAECVYGWRSTLLRRLEREGATKEQKMKVMRENLDLRHKELEKVHHCSPLSTILVPALFTIPAFIASTSIMYATARLPAIASNPTLNEMFLSLAGQDTMPVLPIAIGVVGLLSVEVGTWSPRAMKAMESTNPKDAEAATKGSRGTDPKANTLEVQPSRIAVSFFRLLSVGRAVICVALPAPVNLLWFTSTFLGLIEALIFNSVEASRKVRLWGRNSPLLRLDPKHMQARGFNLSPVPPLERAGNARHYATHSPNSHENESSTSSIREKYDRLRSMNRNEFITEWSQWRNRRISRLADWLEKQEREAKEERRQSLRSHETTMVSAPASKVLPLEKLAKRKRIGRQWSITMSQLKKAEDIELRKQHRAQVQRLRALDHIPGLQPARRQLKPDSSDTAKPLFA